MNCSKIDDKTKACLDEIIFLTNTTNLDQFVGTKTEDVSSYVSSQKNIITDFPDKYMICSSQRPYSINKTCQSCPSLFSVNKLDCFECMNGQIYNDTSRICFTPRL